MADGRIKLGVSGALGKMGSRIISLASQDKDFEVILALERISHPEIGEKVAGVEVASSLDLIKNIDGMIEFSSPEASLDHLDYVVKFKKSLVLGTTGFSEEQKKEIVRAAAKVPIVFSPNMSIGVNVLFHLLQQALQCLPKEYKARVKEAHHIYKKDAPSGTAQFLAQIIKQGQGVSNVDIQSIREGEIIGDHEIILESPWDTIRLSHSAKTRDIFALGALKAMKFITRKKKGLYNMADVLKETQ